MLGDRELRHSLAYLYPCPAVQMVFCIVMKELLPMIETQSSPARRKEEVQG